MPNYSGSWNLVQQMQGVAAGNWPIQPGTVGIFALGYASGASTTRDKYTFSGCVVSSATASSATTRYGSAAGNSTVGIFALGCNSTTRDKYTYSGCVVSSGAASSATSYQGSAAGNSTVGIFALGNCTTTRNKYTYSGDVNASAAAATAASSQGSAASNGTCGVNI